MRKPFVAVAMMAWAVAVSAQQIQFSAVPYVHPNLHTIDMTVGANWSWVAPSRMMLPSRRGNLGVRSQFQTWNGVPLNVASYTRSYNAFGGQRVPYLSTVPLFGGLFRNQWRTRQWDHANFSVRSTLVDPAGNPVFRQETQPFYRVPGIPAMHGLVP
tara:strand:+ start:48920 stop:49390 length:471 start_codon:yes stop_codon:yes gene_type:complete